MSDLKVVNLESHVEFLNDGHSIVSHEWDIADGEIVAGKVTDSSLSVAFSVGVRWIKMTIEDDTGMKLTRYGLLHVHDDLHFIN